MTGIWIWPELVLARGAETVVRQCAQVGVTDLFFLTKGLNGSTAFPCPLTPSMAAGRDLLREMLDAAHRHGARVHAWFTSAHDAAYKAAHPESGLAHFQRGRDRDIVSIRDESYLHFMQDVIRAMARRYDVDGLHLDYIRYNHLSYGWSEADERRYADAGVDVARAKALIAQTFYADPPRENAVFDAWRNGEAGIRALSQIRRASVNAFARGLIAAARSENPRLCISAALMPEGAYDDLAFSDLHYGQNYADLAALIDLALPMAYSQAFHQDSRWVARVALGTVRHGLQTLIGLHAYEGATGLTLGQDVRAVQALHHPLIAGPALFRAGATVLARMDGGSLIICNATHEPLVRLLISGAGQQWIKDLSIAPGATVTFPCPQRPETVRAFTAAGETCVYLAQS